LPTKSTLISGGISCKDIPSYSSPRSGYVVPLTIIQVCAEAW
jgi:hypothetical protein